jgi:GT2 family glycosyltransferase
MSNYGVVTIGYKSLENIKNRIEESFNGENPPSEFIIIINYYSEVSWDILNFLKNEKRVTRFVFCSQNIGFAKAMNLGSKLCKCENIILLNDDCSINQNTLTGLSLILNNNYNVGISTILLGGKNEDTIPVPQGFILGIKKNMIKKIGGYVYDEIGSPLGCERELTYRAKFNGYELKNNPNLYYNHVHDISNNPTNFINYLGDEMTPQGEKAFQFYTESELDKKINFYKNNI